MVATKGQCPVRASPLAFATKKALAEVDGQPIDLLYCAEGTGLDTGTGTGRADRLVYHRQPGEQGGGTRQMMMGTFLHQRAMVAFDWPGAAVVAAIMLVVIIATVLVMTRLAKRLNPMAT